MTNMKRKTTLLCVLCLAAMALAKPTYERTYGLAAGVSVTGSDITPDGGLIVCATDDTLGWLLRLDMAGNVLWSRSYDATQGFFSNATRITFMDVSATPDGGYMVVGHTPNPYFPETPDYLIGGVDSVGTPLWGGYGGAASWGDYLHAIAARSGTQLLVGGRTGGIGGGYGLVAAVDPATGQSGWGADFFLLDGDAAVNDISVAADGSVLVAGSVFQAKYASGLMLEWQIGRGAASADIHDDGTSVAINGNVLCRTLANGTLDWAVQCSLGDIADIGHRPDGHILITGTDQGYIWAAELDAAANILWVHRIADLGDALTAMDL